MGDIERMILQSVSLVTERFGQGVQDAAKLGAQRIRERTASGELRTNAPYSESWARRRRKKGLRTDVANLDYEGDMLSSIDVIELGGRAGAFGNRDSSGRFVSGGGEIILEIGAAPGKEAQKAYAHHTGHGKLPVREFMYLEDQEVDDIVAKTVVDRVREPVPSTSHFIDLRISL